MVTWAAWKRLEKTIADRLGGNRNQRGDNFGAEKCCDVEIEDFSHWKIDAKYRKQPFKHHGMLKEIRAKYCGTGDVAILITKNKEQRGEVVSMSLDDFAGIVTALRALKQIQDVGREGSPDPRACSSASDNSADI